MLCLGSDIDPSVVNFHHQGLKNRNALADRIYNFCKRPLTHAKYKVILENIKTNPTGIDAAAWFYVCQMYSYRGIHGGFCAGCKRPLVENICFRMKSAKWPRLKIKREDVITVLKRRPPANSVTYLDPPYLDGTKNYVYNSNAEWHQKLLQVLNETKHVWLMSMNDSPTVRKMYQNFTLLKIFKKQARKHELLIISPQFMKKLTQREL